MKEDISEVLNRLIGTQVKGVKLGPGVVGRNSSIAWALLLVMLAGVVSGAYLHSVWLVLISLLGAIGTGLTIACMNVKFGKENPAAALLEGAEFLEFHQMQATAVKGNPAVVELSSAKPTQSPVQLPSADKNQLDSGSER